jgi:hypothetical protein
VERARPLEIALGVGDALARRGELGASLADLLAAEAGLELGELGEGGGERGRGLVAAGHRLGGVEARDLGAGFDAVAFARRDRDDPARELEAELGVGGFDRARGEQQPGVGLAREDEVPESEASGSGGGGGGNDALAVHRDLSRFRSTQSRESSPVACASSTRAASAAPRASARAARAEASSDSASR